MYRFRELLHIYTTLVIGVILIVAYFFIPQQPLHIMAAQFIMIICAGFIAGVVLKIFVDITFPPIDPLGDFEQYADGEIDLILTDEELAEQGLDLDLDLNLELGADLGVGSGDGLAMFEPELTAGLEQSAGLDDDYLDEGFLDELEESYQ